ncbi:MULTISPECIES: FUSC family protein [Streptosporangium]|uniref:Membrane protein YccC n=1 Tax=Streptosporangium brasiliense TaxID=47480 RepID=A0ABT9R2X1_9ACTN|nr:FUSC family protein [Streptosporangium brasiliense]MDP9863579.1 putative membrane protein YccC [Streptosporangium brasiliense]
MRKIAEALRGDFVISGRPAWGYSLLCALGICLPLLLGVVLGRVPQGAAAALGGYLTVFGDAPGLPYGERARKLLVATLMVTLGSGLGALMQPHPWPAVAVMGLVALAGGYWPVISVSSMLAVALAYFAPAGMSVPVRMELAAAGGLLMTLLLVVLWPVRRLQPLRAALEEAGAALADLLEAGGRAPLSDESWEVLRRRAGTAVDDAARAFCLYRVSEEDDRALRRLLATLTRILHETVALRVLRAAAAQADMGTEWAGELEEAVGPLARALREAVSLGGSAAVPEALEAMGHFAERVEEVRRSAHAGEAPLPAAALLGQVRRCLDRIGMAVRSVAQQAAEGVEIGPRLPRFGRLRRPVFSTGYHPVRLGLAVSLAMALMLVIHEHYAKWFVVTVIVSLRPAYFDTVERVVLRTAGTAVGSAGAAVVLAVAPGHLYLLLFIAVCAVLGFALRGASYGYWTIFATPLSLMLSDFSLPLGWGAAAARVVLTAAGGMLALAFARLLWPRGQRAELTGRAVDMLGRHAALVRSLIDQDPDEVRARVSSAADAADRFAASLDRLDKEPGGSAPRRLRDAVTAARRLRDNALALFAVPPPSEESGPTATVLDMVADRLENVAEAVGTERPETPPDDLDRVLDELGAHVDVLTARRLDEVAGGAADQMTGVRRGIMHAAAAQPTLKGLSAEALRLAALTAPRR